MTNIPRRRSSLLMAVASAPALLAQIVTNLLNCFSESQPFKAST